MADKDKIVRIVLLVIGILLLTGLFFWQKSSPSAPAQVLENPPSIPEYLIGGLTEEQKTEVETYKKAILEKISSGASFNKQEKETVSSIIETQNHIYQFSEEQVRVIKSALLKK